MIPNTNDGSAAPPRLLCLFNLLARDGLPEKSLDEIREAGYDGVQFAAPASAEQLAACRRLGLTMAGCGRVNEAQDAAALAQRLAGEGLACGTVHLGWGIEDDDAGARLIEAVLGASERSGIPLYVETHRATLFQDMWRTVQFVRRFPELRFNGDFSHWYTGLEMVYGGFERKLQFIAPIMERVRFMHGRIGNPGCIQVSIGDGNSDQQPYVAHFREMWTRSFSGFLGAAGPGDYIGFAAELLAPWIYYARTFPDASGHPREESDRWEQSLVLCRIARQAFRTVSATQSRKRNA